MGVVLSNLLENAWKYTGKATHASIEYGRTVHPAEGEVFYVRDNGVGFDMANAEDLFRLFHRAHEGEYEGNGIGLATVGRAIRRQGGKIWGGERSGPGGHILFHLRCSVWGGDSE